MKSGSYFFKHDFGRNKRSRKHMKLSGDGLSLKWKAVGATETVAADTPGASSGGIFRSSSFSRTTSSAHAPANSPRPPHAVADSCSFSAAAAAASASSVPAPPRASFGQPFGAVAPVGHWSKRCSIARTLHTRHRRTTAAGHSARRHEAHRWLPPPSAVLLTDVSHIIYGPYTDTFAKKTAIDRTDPRWACFSLVLRESRTVRTSPRPRPRAGRASKLVAAPP